MYEILHAAWQVGHSRRTRGTNGCLEVAVLETLRPISGTGLNATEGFTVSDPNTTLD
jgi:hypothetical protein